MGVSGQFHAQASLPSRKEPITHWIGGWVGPRAVLDVVVKRKIPSTCQESNPRTPIVQPIAQRYTDSAVMALLRRISGPKRDVDRSWRKLHNVKLHNLFSSLIIFRVIK
jgi:hypothetical protein